MRHQNSTSINIIPLVCHIQLFLEPWELFSQRGNRGNAFKRYVPFEITCLAILVSEKKPKNTKKHESFQDQILKIEFLHWEY